MTTMNTSFAKWNYNQTIAEINGLAKKTAEMQIEIGRVLSVCKDFHKKTKKMDKYAEMFKSLRFTKETGDKFIQIFKDKNLKDYLDYVPTSWNAMYAMVGLTSNQWDSLINKKGLNFSMTISQVSSLVQDAKDTTLVNDLDNPKKMGKTPKANDPNIRGKKNGVSKLPVKDALGVEHEGTDLKDYNNAPTEFVKSINLKYNFEGVSTLEAKAINFQMQKIHDYINVAIRNGKIDKFVTLSTEEKSLSSLGIKMEDVA